MGFQGATAGHGPGHPVLESLPDSELSRITSFSLTPTENLSLGDGPCVPEPCHMDKPKRKKQMLSMAPAGPAPRRRSARVMTSMPVVKLLLMTLQGTAEPPRGDPC